MHVMYAACTAAVHRVITGLVPPRMILLNWCVLAGVSLYMLTSKPVPIYSVGSWQ